MLDKILRVNSNLVVIYYTSRPPLHVTSDNGTALEAALMLLTHALPYIADEDLEPTIVLGREA